MSYFEVQTTSLFLFARPSSTGTGKSLETKEATASAAAGSARDMLSGAGASSGDATDPTAAVEAAVSAAPDDPSDKLNLQPGDATDPTAALYSAICQHLPQRGV